MKEYVDYEVYVQDFCNEIERIFVAIYGFEVEVTYEKTPNYFRLNSFVDLEKMPFCMVTTYSGEIYKTNDGIHALGNSVGNILDLKRHINRFGKLC